MGVVALVAAYAALRWRGRYAVGRARPFVSRVDGMRYRVHQDDTDPLARDHGAGAAADALALLNGRVVDLLRWLRARYLGGRPPPGASARRRGAVERLLRRYNPDNLVENSPKDPSKDTAYAMNKGSLIAICLRERDPAESGDPRVYDIHPPGVLTFVALHEMSHIAIDEFDHPPVFWSTFRFLLEEAEAAGIYASPDFAAAPQRYCGVTVDYNPRWDPALAPI